MTLKKQESLSREEQGELNIDSVFDFLYYDSLRIASFLSQFDNSGHLREVILSESAQGSKNKVGKLKVGGGVPLMASGEGDYSRAAGESRELGNQRIYDPTWANARAFLDLLDEHNMIERNIAKATMGQFVLCSGSLSVTTLQLMEKIWKLPSVQSLIKAGAGGPSENRQQRRAKGRSAASSTTPEVDLVIDLLSILPHTIQAKISGTSNVWCSLSENGMSVLASDVTLKHGITIPGTWHALGVLDAKPEHDLLEEVEVDVSDGKEVAAKLMTQLGPLAKRLVGRPDDHFAITPLLIFREVIAN